MVGALCYVDKSTSFRREARANAHPWRNHATLVAGGI
jgi:hypothetical protein